MNDKLKISAISVLASAMLVTAFTPSTVHAWGSLAHMGIIIEAGKKEKLPVPPEYMGAFLAGATEPDIAAMAPGAQGVANSYHVYHDALFIEAMKKVAETKKSPEREILMARAMGYAAHGVGDSVAHGVDGYSNTKKVFDAIPEKDKAHHLMTEFMVDTLEYAKNKKEFDKYKLNFIDADTLIEVRSEYAKMKGITLENDKKTLQKDILKHRATVITDKAVADNLIDNRPEIVAQMDGMLADRFAGIKQNQGIDLSVAKMADAFKTGKIASVTKQKDERKLMERVEGFASKIVNNAANTGIELTEDALVEFGRIGFIRKRVETLASSKLKGNEGLMGRFFLSVLSDRDSSLKEALYKAELPMADMNDPTVRYKMARAEVESLKVRADAAYAEYKARPWWKFWLYLTNADKKKYEKAQALYELKKSAFDKLTLPSNVASSSSSEGATSSPVSGENSAASAANAAGQADPAAVVKALERYRAAYKGFVEANMPESGAVLDELKAASAGYEKLTGNKPE